MKDMGNNSNICIGEFIRDKNNVKPIPTSSFLKNSNSLNKFKIKTKLVIIIKTKKRDLKKTIDINLIWTFIVIILFWHEIY